MQNMIAYSLSIKKYNIYSLNNLVAMDQRANKY